MKLYTAALVLTEGEPGWHAPGAVGLDADLIAVGGDPRVDLSVIDDLRLIVARGVEIAPDPLPPLPPLSEEIIRRFIATRAERVAKVAANKVKPADEFRHVN